MFFASESLTLLWNHAPYRYNYPASLKTPIIPYSGCKVQ